MSLEVLCAKRGEKRRLYVCAGLSVFSILTSSFFFDGGVSVLEIALLGNPGRMGWEEPQLAM